MATAAPINLEQLRQFGIEPQDVLEIEKQPWLSSEQLCAIARQLGLFRLFDVDFADIKDNQIVYKATLVTNDDVTFSRSGVATVGEKLPDGKGVSTQDLAASRALRSALAMAGVDPFRTAPVEKLASVTTEKKHNSEAAIRAVERSNNIKLLHALATEKGLIVNGKYSLYRTWLLENFDVDSSANFTEEQFALAINKLKQVNYAG
jgi:hypothetical protein